MPSLDSPTSPFSSWSFCTCASPNSANTLSRSSAGNLIHQVVAVLDIAAIDSHHNVSGLEPSLLRRASRLHLLHQDPVLESVDAVHCAREPLPELNPNRPARYLVAGAHEVVVYLGHGVGWHSEADALIARGLGEDCRVHSNTFTIH